MDVSEAKKHIKFVYLSDYYAEQIKEAKEKAPENPVIDVDLEAFAQEHGDDAEFAEEFYKAAFDMSLRLEKESPCFALVDGKAMYIGGNMIIRANLYNEENIDEAKNPSVQYRTFATYRGLNRHSYEDDYRYKVSYERGRSQNSFSKLYLNTEKDIEAFKREAEHGI